MPRLMKYRKMLYQLSTGGVCFGMLGAWELVDFGSVFTQVIVSLISLLISAFFGQSLADLFYQQALAG